MFFCLKAPLAAVAMLAAKKGKKMLSGLCQRQRKKILGAAIRIHQEICFVPYAEFFCYKIFVYL